MTDDFDETTGRSTRSSASLRQQLREAIAYDDARESAPHEHLATLLGAGAFMLCALRAPGRMGAVLHAMVAGALLVRAASGRDGLRSWADANPARPDRTKARSSATAPDAEPLEPRVTPGF